MANFKKGDMVILIGSKPEHAYSIGYDYEVRGYFEGRVIIFNPSDLNGSITGPDPSGSWFAHEAHLRKKKPPQEKSTWEEVKNITGWNPNKVKEGITDEY